MICLTHTATESLYRNGVRTPSLKIEAEKERQVTHEYFDWKHSKKFGHFQALSLCHLDITKAKWSRFAGRLGPGKNHAVAYYCCDLEAARTQGRSSIGNRDVTTARAYSSRRFFVFQNLRTFSFIYGCDNVLLGWKSCLVKNAQAFLKNTKACHAFIGMACSFAHLANRFPSSFLAMRQKTAYCLGKSFWATQPESTVY